MIKTKESKIVNAIRGYISMVVPKSKENYRQGSKNQENNVVYIKQPSEISGKKLYAERKYRTWNREELTYINRGILKAIRNCCNVNLSELKGLMPYRSISSIRCKVHQYINRNNFNIGTYTEND